MGNRVAHKMMLRRTVEAANLAHEIGRTPLEVMLNNMNFYMTQAEALQARATSKGKEKAVMAQVILYRDKAQQSASGAAPYVHARLATITQNVNVRSLRELQGALEQLSDDQLDTAIEELEGKVGTPALPPPRVDESRKIKKGRHGKKEKVKRTVSR